jgi:phosphoribosyl 1,2-cyclic phosphodiesterase
MKYCSLVSGSSGNSHYIATDSTKILIDVGVNNKQITIALDQIGVNPLNIDAIFLTHEHSDHIMGLKVFMKKNKTKLYISQKTYELLKDKIPEDGDIYFINEGETITINDMEIQPFKINHDAIEPFGYNIHSRGKRLSIMTDIGRVDDYILESLSGSEFLVLESNHDVNMLNFGPYPYPLKRRILSEKGHLSNEDAAICISNLYKRGKLKSVILAHLSKENNFPELAFLTVKERLEKEGIFVGRDIHIDLATRDKISSVYLIT